MANAGMYGVNIGAGAASGAAAGTTFGPWGTLIGGAVGGLGGALQTLLSSSDDAKKRKKAMEEYEAQRAQALGRYKEDERNRMYREWQQRFAARNGLNSYPAYAATHHDTYDPELATAEFDSRHPRPDFSYEEPQPNYGSLVQSLGSLGSTVGGLVRQSSINDQIGLQQIANSGNPWIAYAEDPDDPLQRMALEQARQAAWQRTGGW